MKFEKTHLPCPHCDSSDGYALNDNGIGKCFSCHVMAKHPDGAPTEPLHGSERPKQHIPKDIPADGLRVEYTHLIDRRIELDTCKFFGVGWYEGNLLFPLNGNRAYKVRVNGEKKFKIIGNFKDSPQLFGQDRFNSGGRSVVVTEGELDAMSVWQAMGCKIPAVSVRNGASSAVNDVKANFEWLDTFEDVVFWFDSDEAGQKAQKECAELFSHKAKVVQPIEGFKDANDYLMQNAQKELINRFYRANRYTPDGIISIANLHDEVMKPIEAADVMYPFDELNKITYGIRKGELVTLTAGSGLGKSQFLRECVYHIFENTNEKIGMLFLEEGVRKTVLSLMSLHLNKQVHLPDNEVDEGLKEDAFNHLTEGERLFFFQHFGSTSVDNIVARVRFLAKAMECKYIFLDHISIIVSGGDNGDERKALDEIMTKLRMLVEETGIALLCVSHLKRPDNKGHEEGAATSLAQLRGSGSIAQLSDMVIGLERNAQSDDSTERNITRLRVLKNRFSGETGSAGAILYDKPTGRMLDYREEEL